MLKTLRDTQNPDNPETVSRTTDGLITEQITDVLMEQITEVLMEQITDVCNGANNRSVNGAIIYALMELITNDLMESHDEQRLEGVDWDNPNRPLPG